MVSQQSPAAEISERVAEAAPGLVVATHLEAIDNFRRANAAYRQRVADSHRWQAESLGTTATKPAEEDEVGNLIVTGDVYGNNAAEILAALNGQPVQPSQNQPSTAATAATTSPGSGWAQTLGTAALVLAGLTGAGGIGAAVPWLLGAYSQPAAQTTTTTINNPGTSQELGVSVVPGGATKQE